MNRMRIEDVLFFTLMAVKKLSEGKELSGGEKQTLESMMNFLIEKCCCLEIENGL